MSSPRALLSGIVNRFLPGGSADDPGGSNDQPVRLTKYREVWVPEVAPTDHGYAEEGSYILCSNPTIGTGMTWVAAQTSFSDTTPNFYIYNGEAAGGKSIGLRFLKLIAMAVGTAATAWHYAFVLDNVARAITTDHTSTGPSSAGVGVQAHTLNGLSALPNNFLIQVQNSATASVIAASSANKIIVARGCLGGLNIVGDEMQINFGSYDAGANSAPTAAEGAGQPGRRVSCEAPVLIPPGWSLTGHLWAPSSSASINPEFMLGLRAR